jgi:hypothetical protein
MNSSDSEDESSYNVLEDYITSNTQISGGNVREFLRTHESPPMDTGLVRRFEEHVSRRNRSNINDYDVNIALAERIGRVEIGVSDINNVSNKFEGNVPLDGDCVICQNALATIHKKGTSLRILKCMHIYCAQCISQWLQKNKSCPVCKVILE